MAAPLPPLRIAIAHRAGHSLTETDRLERAGITFLTADAVENLGAIDGADAVVIDYALAGASEFVRMRPVDARTPAIALVGRDGPCRTVEQSLLRAEADGVALALPKPAGPTDIVIAALGILDQRSPEAGWRIRLRQLVGAQPG